MRFAAVQIVVELDEYELTHAAMAGCQRRIASIKKARPQVYGAGERKNYWQIDIVGMIAEYAVAKAFDRHWQPATNQRLADLPGDVSYFQVRSTEHRDGHLFLHPGDKDAPYILAIVADRHVLLAGWIYLGKGLKVGENRSADTWWVRQDQLTGFEDWLEPVAWSETVRPKG
jgi:hypothetical protein